MNHMIIEIQQKVEKLIEQAQNNPDPKAVKKLLGIEFLELIDCLTIFYRKNNFDLGCINRMADIGSELYCKASEME